MQPYVIVPCSGAEQADEWVRLGVEAQSAGKFADAERHYRNALRLDPRNFIATQNLAVVYAQTGQLNDALLTIERATLWDPAPGVAWMNWGLMALEADKIDVALAMARRSLEKEPESVQCQVALALILGTAGEAKEAVEWYDRIVAKEPTHPVAGPNGCFVRTLTPALPAEMLAVRTAWYSAHRWRGVSRPNGNHRSGVPLKVGYVSGDFKRHSAAMIFGSVIFNHDRTVVDPFLYSTLPVEPEKDEWTRKFLEVAGPNWRDISTYDDDQAETTIRKDGIDILVDLSGHTNGCRLALFTRKPAPIQATGWGFAHGTGIPEIDYFFGDPVAVPQDQRQHYAEQVYDLPCIVSYVPPVDYKLAATSGLPYHKNGYVTFGTYARYEKFSPECLATFAQILERVPDSRLELKDRAYRRPYSIQRVYEAMPTIAKERLLFSLDTSHPDHMLSYQRADLILDPFPHTGGIVSLEQLYMGVPVLTLYGTHPGGRTTSSVLTALGKTDWIAHSPEEYVEKAVVLSKDPQGLGLARKTLREEFLHSPVITGYAQAVERAYQAMWSRWSK